MRVLKGIVCEVDKPNECHQEIKLLYPNIISILHHPDNHIIFEGGDYDTKGSVKAIAWKKDEELKLSPELQIRYREIAKREFV